MMVSNNTFLKYGFDVLIVNRTQEEIPDNRKRNSKSRVISGCGREASVCPEFHTADRLTSPASLEFGKTHEWEVDAVSF